MPPGDFQVTTNAIGKSVEGKLMRPYAFETIGVFLLDKALYCVAIKFYPVAGDAVFKEPLIVAIAEQDIDDFIRAVRLVQNGRAAEARKGGTS